MLSFLTSNWEWCLLALYVLEKGVKLSPSKKDDVIFDMIIKPIVDKIKVKQVPKKSKILNNFSGGLVDALHPRDIPENSLSKAKNVNLSKETIVSCLSSFKYPNSDAISFNLVIFIFHVYS